MRIEADARIGEFGHVQRADTDQAGACAGGDQIRIGRGRGIAPQHRRAGERHPPLDVEQILPADRHAVERTQRRAVAQPLARRLGLAAGALRQELDEDGLVVRPGDPVENVVDEIDGIQRSIAELAGKL